MRCVTVKQHRNSQPPRWWIAPQSLLLAERDPGMSWAEQPIDGGAGGVAFSISAGNFSTLTSSADAPKPKQPYLRRNTGLQKRVLDAKIKRCVCLHPLFREHWRQCRCAEGAICCSIYKRAVCAVLAPRGCQCHSLSSARVVVASK